MAAALDAQDHLYTLIEKGDGEPVGGGDRLDRRLRACAGRPRCGRRRARRLAGDVDPLAHRHRGRVRRAVRRAAASGRGRRSIASPPRCGPPRRAPPDRSRSSAATTCRATATPRGTPRSPPRRAPTPRCRNGSRRTALPELDGRPHHAGDRRRRPRVAARHARHRGPLAGRRRAVPPVGDGGRLRARAGRRGRTSARCSPTGIHDWELYKLRLLNAGHSCIAYLSALGRHHVRPRGDGDAGDRGRSSKSSFIARPCPHSPRFPAIRGSSTSPPCWSGSRMRACATRSPACASTAASSSPAS